MPKHKLFFLCSILVLILSGCSTQSISDNIKGSGFEIVYDSSEVAQDVQEWVISKESSTGIYKNRFLTGNYLLISLGNHKTYSVKKIDVKKDNFGYLFNITVSQHKSEGIADENLLISPILVQTEHPNENYDIKIIYQ